MGSHSVTAIAYLPPDAGKHVPPNPSRAGRYLIYLPQRDERLRLAGWLVINQAHLFCRQSSSEVVTGPAYSNRNFVYQDQRVNYHAVSEKTLFYCPYLC